MKRSKTAVPTSLDAAKALIEESVLVRWQHWRTWLDLNLERLRLREEMEAADAGFDLDEAPQAARLREIEAQLAAIPSEERGEFQTAYEDKRAGVADDDQRSGSLPKDVAEIDRLALQSLLDLCNGDPAAERPGLVPLKGQWFKLDTRALSSVPSAAQYSVGTAGRRKRADLPGILGISVMLLVVGVFLWAQYAPRGPEPAEEAAAPTLLLNDAPAASWRPIALAVQGSDTRLPVQPTTPESWPFAEQGVAGWREGSLWPLELCVAREALPEAGTTIQLASEGAALLRTYQLAASAGSLSTPPALTLSACDDQGEVRYGVLSSASPLPSATFGETQALATSPGITVLSVAVDGQAQALDIPADKVRISLQIATKTPVADWSALKPRLQLATGALLEPMANPAQMANGNTMLTYLADSYPAQIAAAWEMSDLSSGETIRWRVTLPAPASRLAYLGRYLRVETPRASLPEAGRLRLEIPLTTTSPDGIMLRYEDISARQGNTVIALPTFTHEEATATPGQTTTLTLDLLPPEQGQEVTLSIGPQVFAIQLP